MDVSWLQKRLPNTNPDIQSRWTRVMKVLDDGVDFKRRIVENLRPTLLDNMGLLPAVRWITQETCTRAGLQYTEIYPEHRAAADRRRGDHVVSAGAGIAGQYRQARACDPGARRSCGAERRADDH
jgi:hypothetical protein